MDAAEPILIPEGGIHLHSYLGCRTRADYLERYRNHAKDAQRLRGRKSFATGRDLDAAARFHLNYIRQLYQLNNWDLAELNAMDAAAQQGEQPR